jgi:hypothetical protein
MKAGTRELVSSIAVLGWPFKVLVVLRFATKSLAVIVD